jgi:hypothetical protein
MVGTAGTRTQDQSLKRALLYQLSYRPPGKAAMLAKAVEERAHFQVNAAWIDDAITRNGSDQLCPQR